MTSKTLHIINKAASNQQLYIDCLDCLHEDDAIILIESAVYTAYDHERTILNNLNVPIYALKTDVQARGLLDKSNDKIPLIDDNEFVELCCQYQKSVSWF